MIDPFIDHMIFHYLFKRSFAMGFYIYWYSVNGKIAFCIGKVMSGQPRQANLFL